MQSYCSDFYGSTNWNLDHPAMHICTAWHKGLRTIWELPFRTHAVLLAPICSFFARWESVGLSLCYFVECLMSNNSIIESVTRLVISCYWNGFLFSTSLCKFFLILGRFPNTVKHVHHCCEVTRVMFLGVFQNKAFLFIIFCPSALPLCTEKCRHKWMIAKLLRQHFVNRVSRVRNVMKSFYISLKQGDVTTELHFFSSHTLQ